MNSYLSVTFHTHRDYSVTPCNTLCYLFKRHPIPLGFAAGAKAAGLVQSFGDNHATWTEDRLWDAFAVIAPDKVKGRSQAGRFADLVSLVRFALEQQPVLAPFADSVGERFNEWLMDKAQKGTTFTTEQLGWLNIIRDHIATSLSIEPDDFDYAPFSQQGGLGKAHQLFGEQLPTLLQELNETLAA